MLWGRKPHRARWCRQPAVHAAGASTPILSQLLQVAPPLGLAAPPPPLAAIIVEGGVVQVGAAGRRSSGGTVHACLAALAAGTPAGAALCGAPCHLLRCRRSSGPCRGEAGGEGGCRQQPQLGRLAGGRAVQSGGICRWAGSRAVPQGLARAVLLPEPDGSHSVLESLLDLECLLGM